MTDGSTRTTDDRAPDRELLDAYRRYLSAPYADFLERQDLHSTAIEARGAFIRDSRGRTFLDFTSGYGIFSFGHNPPEVIDALRADLGAAPLWNRPFLSAPQAQLAEKLVALTGRELQRVFICSSGAEAVDSAIKLARLTTRRTEIIAAQGAFHGYTLGALSACGVAGQAEAFAPLLPDVTHVPYGDASALERAVSARTAAVLLEPIQAEVGAEAPPDGYLAAARSVCDRAGALLVLDEVRTGLGRTGSMFAFEHDGVTPDVLLIGKALAGGIVPIGAMLARARLWSRFGLLFAMSASSFAGNRLACVAALATLSFVESSATLARSRPSAEALRAGLTALQARHPTVVHRVTGRGFLLGVHFTHRQLATEVVRSSIANGLLVAAAFCNPLCVLLEPPLIVEPEHVTRALAVLDAACEEASRLDPRPDGRRGHVGGAEWRR